MARLVQVVQVVRVARTISLDDRHSENTWFSWSKPSIYREKLICHVCDGRTDGRTDGGEWKIRHCSVGPETATTNKGQKQLDWCKTVLISERERMRICDFI